MFSHLSSIVTLSHDIHLCGGIAFQPYHRSFHFDRSRNQILANLILSHSEVVYELPSSIALTVWHNHLQNQNDLHDSFRTVAQRRPTSEPSVFLRRIQVQSVRLLLTTDIPNSLMFYTSESPSHQIRDSWKTLFLQSLCSIALPETPYQLLKRLRTLAHPGWANAMIEEMNALEHNNTSTLVEFNRQTRRTIGCNGCSRKK
ncbi:hypothetical protein OSB04_un000854 [Centaurea solstitialis]|uniref:Uncharacterized protein n=1 Tax=Centaurea solstitialis TaxID=347529 RepID=A0AA38W284_9ASTR|nr:hypothetical protein OSB04_un000854 [Centaurea solstitialis]